MKRIKKIERDRKTERARGGVVAEQIYLRKKLGNVKIDIFTTTEL
jgi:hypothetical protein